MRHCSDPSPQASQAAGGPQPDWCDAATVVLDLDVTALLATGEHPLERVKLAVAQCASGQVVQLRSSFQPAPLLALFTAEGMRVWCGQEGALFRTCIGKP